MGKKDNLSDFEHDDIWKIGPTFGTNNIEQFRLSAVV